MNYNGSKSNTVWIENGLHKHFKIEKVWSENGVRNGKVFDEANSRSPKRKDEGSLSY
jgi:hypothetical protein